MVLKSEIHWPSPYEICMVVDTNRAKNNKWAEQFVMIDGTSLLIKSTLG